MNASFLFKCRRHFITILPSWISPSSALVSSPRCLKLCSINNGSTKKQQVNILESYVRSAAATISTTASSVAAINFTLKSITPERYLVKNNFPLQLLQKLSTSKRIRLLNINQTHFSCDVDIDTIICRSFKSSAINQHINVSYILINAANISIRKITYYVFYFCKLN